MDKYICTKIVEAEPMYRYEAFEKGYHRIAKGDDIKNQPNDYGYHILYENGYHSWCPAKEFREHNEPLNPFNETGVLMNSNDYMERFIAEYRQLQIRYNALSNMCQKWDNEGVEGLGFTPSCPREMYNDQLLAMKQYIDILLIRSEIEQINLD